ncbi:MAG: tandem-95 repeat protein [Burkholderiales bacterium]|nr:tandem-95 repeat protein [Burkholderiales bacterium]
MKSGAYKTKRGGSGKAAAARKRIAAAPSRPRARDSSRALAPFRLKPVLETLEPRLLLSADAFPVAPDLAFASDPASTGAIVAPAETGEATRAALASGRELVFVDPRVPDSQALLAALLGEAAEGRKFEIITLDAKRDGIVQVTAALKSRMQIDAVHFITHGSDSAIQLGGTLLDAKALAANLDMVGSWGNALKEDADLLFYGCDLAASARGRALVDWLAEVTGADVAASTDPTGHASKGGDWELEYQVGTLGTAVLTTLPAMGEWDHLLNTYVVSTTSDSGAGSFRQAILNANANAGADTIQFNLLASDPNYNIGTGVWTIDIASELPEIDDAVLIDGWSQAGWTDRPLVELNGQATGPNDDGLVFTAGASKVRGLIINRFGLGGGALNGGTGIVADGSAELTIRGNYIGTDATGNLVARNGDFGIRLISDNNVVGGTTAADRNVVSGNDQDGIFIDGSSGNVIRGNYIGTNKDGTAAIGNRATGVWLRNASGNTIGGANPDERNVISGNGFSGPWEGVLLQNSDNNFVLGNYIGTDALGAAALPNAASGIRIYGGSDGNTVSGNVISGNAYDGVVINQSTANAIRNNIIGADAAGTGPLGNGDNGIWITDAAGNTIGGPNPGDGNLITANGYRLSGSGYNLAGVEVDGNGSTSNAILGNRIYANAGLGIDLNVGSAGLGDGVTANGPDPGTGPNRLQNYPVLAIAETNGTLVHIVGTLSSAANTTFRIEFFAAAGADPSGYGEGERYLDYTTVTTDASGNATFDVIFPKPVVLGEVVTATATNTATNDTSEFAQSVGVTPLNSPPVANDVAANGGEDAVSIPIVLTGADPEGPIASFRLLSLPANGTLYEDAGLTTLAIEDTKDYTATGDALTLYFVPAANWSGTTGFQFTAVDGDGADDATPATATINVAAVNDAPTVSTIADQTISQDGTLAPVPFTVGDVETAAGSLVVTATSSNAALVPDGNIVLGGTDTNRTIGLTPAAGQYGSATITLTVSDGTDTTVTTFVLTVNPANALPVVANATFSIAENSANGTSVGGVSAVDPDPETSFSKIYWTDYFDNHIVRANLDGSGWEALVTGLSGDPVAITVDHRGGKLYWANPATDQIWRSNLDGSSAQVLINTGLVSPTALEVDAVNGMLYWTDAGNSTIQRVNLDGTGRVTLLGASDGLSVPTGIDLDIAGGKMYWVDDGTNQVQRANLDGSSVETLVSGLSQPGSIALDVAGNKLYWADPGTGRIGRANLDGTSAQPSFISVSGGINEIAIDTARGKIYWTEDDNDRIRRANLDGTGTTTVVNTGLLSDPSGIALGPAVPGLAFSIIGGNTGGAFAIDPLTGAITVANASALDFEATPTFILTVQAQDAGGMVGTGTITVNLANVNEAPTGAVTISGLVQEDETLVADTSGIADPDGLGGFAYQWERSTDGGLSWSALPGATTTAYLLGDADVGTHLRVMASYVDGGGTLESLASAAVGPVANVNDPGSIVVSGTPTEDQTLTAAVTDIDGASGPITYQWERFDGASWNPIAGATASAYTLGDADVGRDVRVTAGYTDDRGTSELLVSATVGPIANVGDPGSVSISGAPTEDQTLTATVSDPDGASGPIAYQWERFDGSSWNPIAGATASTYTLGDADVGWNVRVTAAYTDDQGSPENVTSAAVGPVANVNDAPVITSDGGGATASVSVAENATAVTTVTATDVDGPSLIYSISGGADAARFAIDPGTGVLTFAAAPDFENPADADANNVYEVTVQAADGAGGLATQAISVSVVDSGMVLDLFGTAAFSNNDGTQNWKTDWQELGESNGPASGNVRVTGGAFRLGGDEVTITGDGAQRSADLSGATTATLSFAYRRTLLDDSGGSVSVQISPDGTSWTTLATYNLNGSDASFLPQRFDISAFASADTAVRFVGSGSVESYFYVDYVEIEHDGAVASNTAPVLDAGMSPALAPVAEDAGAPVGAVGTLVSQLVDFAVPAGQVDNVTDPDAGALLGIAVVGADTANGAWWYSLDDGASWSVLGAVSDASARLLAADGTTRLYFEPNADYEGTLSSALTFRAWDRSAGANGALADTSVNGGATSFSVDTDTASLVVTAVNDVPVITTSGGALAYTENDPATPIDPAVIVDDVDNTTLASATVRITAGYAPGEDVLSFTPAGGVSGAWDAPSGTLTLVGPATLADWQAALQSVTYENTSEDPTAGPRTIELVVNDGAADSAVATRTVDVAAVNDAPIANDVNALGNEDDASIALTLTGSDVDDPIASFRLASLPANGVLYEDAGLTTLAIAGNDYPALGNARTLYLVPEPEWNGTTGFQFVATDSNGLVSAAPATATIVVDPVNDAPLAADDTYAATEDTVLNVPVPVGVLANDTGLGDGGLILSVVGPVTGGAVALNNDGSFTFTPAADFNGAASFTYQVEDADGDTATATVTIDVAPGDDLPAPADDGYAATEDTPLVVPAGTGVLANDAGLGDGPLTLSVVGPVTGGAVALNNDGSFVFTPAADFNGAASFTYQVEDADGDTATATVIINVAPTDDLPVANDDGYVATEDTVLNVPASTGVLANDAALGDGPLTLGVVGPVTGGAVVLNNDGSFTFTPTTDFNGAASFTYRVEDADGDVSTASVTINVAPTDDAPLGSDNTLVVNEDSIHAFTAAEFGYSDVDGDTLAAVRIDSLSLPPGALLQLAGIDVFPGQIIAVAQLPTLVFTPAADANGAAYASFTFSVQDSAGTLSVTPNVMTIDVAPVNDTPLAAADAAATDQDTPVTTGDVLANDVLGDQPTAIVAFDAVSAQGGSVVLNAGNTFTYTPAATFSGTDTFTYTIEDADGETSTATVTVIVANVANDAPVNIVPGAQIGAEDVPFVFSTGNGNRIAVSDPDAGANPLEVTLTATNGTITLAGITGLTFTVGTGIAESTMTFTGTVVDINAALDGLTFTTALDFIGTANLAIATNDLGWSGAGGPLTDSDGVDIDFVAVNDAPTIDLDADDSSGATGADYQRTYTEQAGPRLIIDAADAVLGDVDSANLASLTVTITNPDFDGAVEFLSADTSATPLITATYNPATGVLTLNGAAPVADYEQALRTVRYENTSDAPSANPRVITFVASDGGSASNVATATVTIAPVNDAPTADIAAASYAAVENAPALVLHGTGMSVADVDALPGSIVDVHLGSISGLLYATQGDSGVTVTGAGSPNLTLTGTIAQINALLAGTTTGTVTYVVGSDSPAPTDTLSLAIDDNGATGSGGAQWGWDSVTVDLTAVNDAPIITIPGATATPEDTPLVFSAGGPDQISITDVDAAGAPVEVSLNVTNGRITLATTANLTFSVGTGTDETAMTFTGTVADINAALDGLVFTPASEFNGSAFLSVSVNDLGNSGLGGPLTDLDFATITVTAVNDAPDGADATVTTPQDTPYVFAAASFGFTDGDAGDALAAVRIDALPAAGTLTLSGVAVTAGQVVDVADIGAGNLVFTPDLGASGVPYASFDFSVQDSGGAFDASPNTLTVNVATPVNNAPDGTDGTVTTAESTDYVLGVADFGFVDPDIGDALSAVRIETLPAQGTLFLSAAAVTAGQTIAAADIAAGNLVFTPDPATTGSPYASLTFTVFDTHGPDFDPTPNTLTINVTAATNDPANTVPGAQVVSEDTALAIAGISVSDPNGDLASVELTVANGTLNVTAAGLASVVSGGPGAITITGSQAEINATLASLVYQGNLHFAGADVLTIVSTDAGGATDTDTVDITVNPVNDAPTVSMPAGYAVTEGSFLALAGTGLAVGDVDAGAANVKVTLSVGAGLLQASGPPAVAISGSGTPVVTLDGSVADINALLAGGMLNYFVTSDAPPGTDTLTLTIDDNGATGAGGPRTASAAATITITAVNDAPVNTLPGGATTLEDTPLVYAGASQISVTDVDAGAAPLQVTLNASNGVVTLAGTTGLAFSSGDGSADASMTFTGTVAAINAALDGLVFTPDLDYWGLALISMSTSDLGASGAGGAQTDVDIATIDVLPVNDAPDGTDTTVTAIEDTPYTFTLSRFGFTDVDAVDGDAMTDVRIDSITLPAGATLQLSGVDVVAGQIITVADINAGNLVFTPVADANGPNYASFTFSVRDSGVPPGPLFDPTPNTMTIDVAPVNDLPIITSDGGGPAAAFTIAENTTAVTTVTATDIDGQPLTYSISGGADAGFFSIDPTTGVLVFSPAPNYEAWADSGADNVYDVTVQVADGFGGTDTQAISVTVTDADDAPFALADGYATNEDTPLTVAPAGALANDYDEDGSPITAALVSGPSYGTLAFNADGSFVYTPNANFFGTDSFVYRVSDGTLASGDATVTITVAGVQDAPTAADGSVTTLAATDYAFTIADFNYSDVDGDPLAQIEITALPASGTLLLAGVPVTLNQVVLAADIAAGQLTYSPPAAAGATFAEQFGFRVHDGTQYETGTHTMTVGVTVLVTPPPPPPPPVDPGPPPPPSGDPSGSGGTPGDDGGASGGAGDEGAVAGGGRAGSGGGESAQAPQAEVAAPDKVEAPAQAADSGAGVAAPSAASAFTSTGNAAPSAPGAREGDAAVGRIVEPQVEPMTVEQQAIQALSEPAFREELDKLRRHQEEEATVEARVAGSVFAVSTSLSVGYVIWLLRGGVLLTSLLSSLPAWRIIDPLPVLSRMGGADDDEDDDSLEELVARRNDGPDSVPGEDDAAGAADAHERAAPRSA